MTDKPPSNETCEIGPWGRKQIKAQQQTTARMKKVSQKREFAFIFLVLSYRSGGLVCLLLPLLHIRLNYPRGRPTLNPVPPAPIGVRQCT